jgi:ribosomal-protein-alanine N-acetyltransferase
VLGQRDKMELIKITKDGAPTCAIDNLSEIAKDVMKSTAEMYQKTGYQPPWVGYLAFDGVNCIGTCAFKTSPVNGRVEIAYFTFPGNEGRGVATSMIRKLIKLAILEYSTVRIFAQTLPERSASTRVLENLGFKQTDEIDHPEDGRVWEWELTDEAQQIASADAPVPQR